MSRSTARFPSSGGPRAALLLTVGAASVALLSACGTGQVSQTAMKVTAVEGVTVRTGHIDVNNATVVFPANARYTAGDDAPLSFVVANDGLTDDRLVSAESSAGRAVVLAPAEAGTTPPPLGCVISESTVEGNTGGGNPTATRPPAPAYVSGSPTEIGTPSASASASPSATPPAASLASPSASASTSTTKSRGKRNVRTLVPHDGSVVMRVDCPHLVITGLTHDVGPSDTLPLRLTFEKAGTVDLDIPVGTPTTPMPREEVTGFETHG